MSVDDILWKNVEAMKSGQPSTSKQAPSRSESDPESSLQPDTVYPSRSTIAGRSADSGESKSRTSGTGRSSSWDPEPTALTNGASNTNGRTDERTPDENTRSLGRVPARPDQRQPERYSFQFWSDQITRLKRLRQVFNMAKDPDDRTEIRLSDMVRTAVDDYLDRETERISRPDDAT